MTGKERLEKIEAKLKTAGYRSLHPPFFDEFKIKELKKTMSHEDLIEKLCNECAEMYEAIFECRTRPAKPLYDSTFRFGNFKSWVGYQKSCLVDPFRRWGQRRRNHKAARLAGLE
jgi:hypothetical protein